MAIGQTITKIQEQGNGTKTKFEFPFAIYEQTDISVYRVNRDTGVIGDALTLEEDYTVEFEAGDELTGSVNYIKIEVGEQVPFPLTEAEDSLIVSNIPPTQVVALPVNSKFREDQIESMGDRIVRLIQQFLEVLARSIKLPITIGPDVSADLPEPQANAVLGWDEDGKKIENKLTIDPASVLLDTDPTLAANSDTRVASQKAIRTYGSISTRDEKTTPAAADIVLIEDSAATWARKKATLANLALVLSPSIMPAGGIIMWSGTIATIPTGWYFCDGNNGTPDLRDRFIVGAKQDDSGTAKTNVTGSLTQSGDGQNISHLHTGPSHTHTGPSHTHTMQYLTAGGGVGGYSIGVQWDTGGVPNVPSWTNQPGQYKNTDSGTGNTGASGTGNTGSEGGTKNVAVYYALAFIMKS
jgi:hypothetical protein